MLELLRPLSQELERFLYAKHNQFQRRPDQSLFDVVVPGVFQGIFLYSSKIW